MHTDLHAHVLNIRFRTSGGQEMLETVIIMASSVGQALADRAAAFDQEGATMLGWDIVMIGHGDTGSPFFTVNRNQLDRQGVA
jgi:hypothetical protein